MAPEVINGNLYDNKADIWSLGVSMFEALFGNTPFTGKNKEDLRINVNNGIVKFAFYNKVSNCCLDFISKCLLINSEKRMSVDYALNHPFMNEDRP